MGLRGIESYLWVTLLTVMIISTAFTIDLATTAVVTKVFLSRPGLAPVFDRHTSLEVTGRDYRTASLSLSWK